MSVWDCERVMEIREGERDDVRLLGGGKAIGMARGRWILNDKRGKRREDVDVEDVEEHRGASRVAVSGEGSLGTARRRRGPGTV